MLETSGISLYNRIKETVSEYSKIFGKGKGVNYETDIYRSGSRGYRKLSLY